MNQSGFEAKFTQFARNRATGADDGSTKRRKRRLSSGAPAAAAKGNYSKSRLVKISTLDIISRNIGTAIQLDLGQEEERTDEPPLAQIRDSGSQQMDLNSEVSSAREERAESCPTEASPSTIEPEHASNQKQTSRKQSAMKGPLSSAEQVHWYSAYNNCYFAQIVEETLLDTGTLLYVPLFQESSGSQCSQCGKVLYDKHCLRRHEASVHQKVKPFPCPHCTKRFSGRSDLAAHVTTVHQREK